MLTTNSKCLSMLIRRRVMIVTMRTLSSYESSGEVRVRFAPSPTGFMHLGGLRTAFYNYLFARKNNGCFILRIEDTDKDRIVSNSIENLEKSLVWAGLKPDEGPSFGGQYGPYLQSQRLELYREKAMQLVSTGHAYRCFCSPIRLDLLRKEAAKNREIIGYDNRCRFLSQKEINEKLSNGLSHTIRLKLTEEPITFDDMVYGEKTFNLSKVESDPIIFKSDGHPTYHLANVVDDHYMKISHILRGMEWHVSTPKHIMMYEAFGWNAPKYAHLPLIMNLDNTKLSKRQQHLHIEYFKNNGYYPEAILNYLAFLSGGFVDKNFDKIDTIEMLTELFDITCVKDHNNKMDIEKIKENNRLCIRTFIKNNQISKLVDDLRALLQNNLGSNLDLTDDYIRHLILWCQDRVFTLNDLVNNQEFKFLWKAPELTWDMKNFGTKQYTDNILRKTIDLIYLNKESNDISQYLKDQFKTNSSKPIEYINVMKLLRMSLTNIERGPPVVELMDMLGKERTIQYLLNASEYVNKSF